MESENTPQPETPAQGPQGLPGVPGPQGETGPQGPAGVCTCSQELLDALQSRISFLESWLQIPVIHLPGYVAPDPVSIETPEPVAEELPVEGE